MDRMEDPGSIPGGLHCVFFFFSSDPDYSTQMRTDSYCQFASMSEKKRKEFDLKD